MGWMIGFVLGAAFGYAVCAIYSAEKDNIERGDCMHTIEWNKDLIKRYPYLLPRNIFTDEVSEDYDYTWTRLDEIEDGWQDLFLKMCEEIREPLIKADYLDDFRFSQLKEKYGVMRCYCFGAPKEVHDIINKYEQESKRTCIQCGRNAAKISTGWISPYCLSCAKVLSEHMDFMDINEWYGGNEDV